MLYDRHHKDNPLSPTLMGVCRMLLYLVAGHTVAVPPPRSLMGASAAVLLIGLTYSPSRSPSTSHEPLAAAVSRGAGRLRAADDRATQGATTALMLLLLIPRWIGVALWFLRRRRPGDVPRAVISLIAGIALLDALLIAGAGAASASPGWRSPGFS